MKDLNNNKISNDIHNEKNYELLYKRLKEGRIVNFIIRQFKIIFNFIYHFDFFNKKSSQGILKNQSTIGENSHKN